MLGAIRPTGAGGGAVATVFGRSGAVASAANDYAASQIAGLGGSSGIVALTPGSTQTLTAASTIAANAGTIPVTAASAITLTSNPQVSTGVNGQRITIVNTGTNAITLVNGNGLIIGQNIIVYGGRAIELIYMSSYSSWLAEGFVPESLALTGIPTAPTASALTSTTQLATTAFVSTAIVSAARPALEVTRPTTQAITLNGFTILIFNTVQLDTNSAYNSTTGVFTVPAGQGGMYEYSLYSGFSSGGNNVQFNPVKNGTRQENLRIPGMNLTTDAIFYHAVTFKIRLAAGDTLSFECYFGAIAGTAVTTSTTQFPSLTLYKIYQ